MLPSWTRRLPVIRTYSALRETQERLAATRDELRRVRDERDFARRVNTHLLPHGRLKDLARLHTESYRAADPFPHVVIDDFLDPALLKTVLSEFDAMDREPWHYTERATERKYSTEDFRHFGPITRTVFSQLNSAPFLWFLHKLTGIEGIIPDAHLRGGGLHEIKRGGALGVHADFNFYPRLQLYRRLNLLVYLNEDWSEAWGGDLELWDRQGKGCVQRISPRFNRAVIFDTSNSSYHGHPRPLECPEERSRKSLALYYYTVDAPADDDRTPHSTVFLKTEGVAAPESV